MRDDSTSQALSDYMKAKDAKMWQELRAKCCSCTTNSSASQLIAKYVQKFEDSPDKDMPPLKVSYILNNTHLDETQKALMLLSPMRYAFPTIHKPAIDSTNDFQNLSLEKREKVLQILDECRASVAVNQGECLSALIFALRSGMECSEISKMLIKHHGSPHVTAFRFLTAYKSDHPVVTAFGQIDTKHPYRVSIVLTHWRSSITTALLDVWRRLALKDGCGVLKLDPEDQRQREALNIVSSIVDSSPEFKPQKEVIDALDAIVPL